MANKPPQKNLFLKYTICFPRVGNKVLMVYRNNEPNKNLWNGLGGKLEPGETAKVSVKREMMEEAEMDLSKAIDIYFAGIVTWNKPEEPDLRVGMYAFVADLPENYETWTADKETREGLLAWKDQLWPSDVENEKVVNNIPHFLSPMLRKDKPQEYYFDYEGHKLREYKVYPLPKEVVVE